MRVRTRTCEDNDEDDDEDDDEGHDCVSTDVDTHLEGCSCTTCGTSGL